MESGKGEGKISNPLDYHALKLGALRARVRFSIFFFRKLGRMKADTDKISEYYESVRKERQHIFVKTRVSNLIL